MYTHFKIPVFVSNVVNPNTVNIKSALGFSINFLEYTAVLRLKGWEPTALDYITPLGLYLCCIPSLEYSSCFHISLENTYVTINISLLFSSLESFPPSCVLLYPENISLISFLWSLHCLGICLPDKTTSSLKAGTLTN